MFHDIRSTGFNERHDGHTDKIPEFDPRKGDHFWIFVATYKVDPEKMLREEVILNKDKLVLTVGPGCFYCEQPYTSNLAKRRCKGS